MAATTEMPVNAMARCCRKVEEPLLTVASRKCMLLVVKLAKRFLFNLLCAVVVYLRTRFLRLCFISLVQSHPLCIPRVHLSPSSLQHTRARAPGRVCASARSVCFFWLIACKRLLALLRPSANASSIQPHSCGCANSWLQKYASLQRYNSSSGIRKHNNKLHPRPCFKQT